MDQNIIQVRSKIELATAADADFAVVASWFIKKRESSLKAPEGSIEVCERDVKQWAGPNVNYPCSVDGLATTIKKGLYESFVLKQDKVIVGFGQLQLLKYRGHLARLVINPEYRGKSISKRLISELIKQAHKQVTLQENKLKQVSLFVNIENYVAIACYQQFGFADSVTPAVITKPADCRYMTLRF
ncbi:MAG: ribosomal protein S18 acetylase RimI-like enzyme [Glaciecola sp.]